MKLQAPELEAEIYYLKASEGGRRVGVRSGYRGQFHYDGKDRDAFQEFLDKEICEPLDEDVKPYSDHDYLSRLGQNIEIHLHNTEIMDKIKFEITGNVTCMLVVKCKLAKEHISPRQIAYNIL
jgi:hypothetical protein